MFRNEWLHKFKPWAWDVGWVPDLCLALEQRCQINLPEPIARLAYKAVPKDASRRQRYNEAWLYELYLSWLQESERRRVFNISGRNIGFGSTMSPQSRFNILWCHLWCPKQAQNMMLLTISMPANLGPLMKIWRNATGILKIVATEDCRRCIKSRVRPTWRQEDYHNVIRSKRTKREVSY